MRLSCVLFVAAAALIATLDATSAASGVTLSKPSMESAVSLVNARESISNDHRFLRTHKKYEEQKEQEEEEEEIMFASLAEKAKAAMAAAKFAGKSSDDMGEVLKTLNKGEIIALFNQGESEIKKLLPGFKRGMDFGDFDDLIKHLPSDTQALLLSGYTKYLHHTNGRV